MRKYKDRINLTPEQVEEIKEKLKTLGIMQGALAERFGITPTVLGTYMSGRVQIPSLIYERLKKMLKLNK